MREKIIAFISLFLLVGAFGAVIISKNKEITQLTIQQSATVKVDGRQLLADFDKDGRYLPYFVKGVAYCPTPVGRHPSDWGVKKSKKISNIFDDEGILRRDFSLLQKMHANTIRIWKGDDTFNSADGRYPIRLTKKTLDIANEYGLKVIAGFWVDTTAPKCKNFSKDIKAPNFKDEAVRKDYKARFVRYVKAFKDHPAILFWAIGNENNYHLNNQDSEQMTAFYSLINEMAQAAHDAEGAGAHPVAFVNGEIMNIGKIVEGTSDVNMTALDIWGANVYRGKTFGELFKDFSERTAKPLWISEFGVDAFTCNHSDYPETGREDQQTQAQWDGLLWDEIVANKDVTIGGTVMEYSDQWWKPNEWLDAGIHNSTQNYFGDGPQDSDCDGMIDWYPPTPDNFYHQEWFGIMAVRPNGDEPDQMFPRKVYSVLQEKFGP